MAFEGFEIDIDVKDKAWETVSDLAGLTQNALITASQQYCARPFSEISLLFTDDTQIQDLNRIYRGKNKPTNVLSFPTSPEFNIPVLGDIVLAFEVIKNEARGSGIALEDHLTHLLIHGYFHLQGLGHETDEAAARMEAYEIKALAGLGIANPYDKEKM